MPFKTTIFALIATALASGASAATYHCKFKDPARRGLIPREVLVEFTADDAAVITDPMLLHMKQAPKNAKRASDTSKLMRASWRLDDMIFSKGEKADIDFSLKFRKNRNRADLHITVHGFANTESGNGTCQQVK